MTGLFAGTSLEQPVTCRFCGRGECECPADDDGNACPPAEQSPRVRREKRRGSWATVIAEIRASPEPGSVGLKPLLKTLRTSLGTGGGLGKGKNGPEIVLQGDHRDAVVARLVGFGYKAKSAGG